MCVAVQTALSVKPASNIGEVNHSQVEESAAAYVADGRRKSKEQIMVAVLGRTGKRLMPTSNYRARKLLKKGRAVIEQYHPFTIRLLDRKDGETQDIEYKSDTGYKHVGVSICSAKHEYVSAQYDLRDDETEHHNNRRKNRRSRRGRKRHRKPRFDNRKASKQDGWLAPSVRHRMERQMDLYKAFAKVMPITSAVFEMGKFDTQLLKAIEQGDPVPEGTDYQQGERYMTETLREAVFLRDGHKCICCGKGIREHAILHAHHIGFRKHDRSNRLANLATVCSNCHTAKNHKPGGKLYGLKPKNKGFAGATFMTSVRWRMLELIRASVPDVEVHIQYGAKTKLIRKELHIPKTHVNDAYAIGELHPRHRTDTEYFVKRKRNNRILEKFYDAKYIDLRDGSKKSGAQLSCGRTNRRESRCTDKNERIYRSRKLSAGRRQIRTIHYTIQPGTKLWYTGRKHTAKGVHCKGTRVILEDGKSVAISKTTVVCQPHGWLKITKEERQTG